MDTVFVLTKKVFKTIPAKPRNVTKKVKQTAKNYAAFLAQINLTTPLFAPAPQLQLQRKSRDHYLPLDHAEFCHTQENTIILSLFAVQLPQRGPFQLLLKMMASDEWKKSLLFRNCFLAAGPLFCWVKKINLFSVQLHQETVLVSRRVGILCRKNVVKTLNQRIQGTMRIQWKKTTLFPTKINGEMFSVATQRIQRCRHHQCAGKKERNKTPFRAIKTDCTSDLWLHSVLVFFVCWCVSYFFCKCFLSVLVEEYYFCAVLISSNVN